MTIRRTTQHLLAATVAASAFSLAACGGADPEPETGAIDPVSQEDDDTPPVPDEPTTPLTSIPDDFPLDAALGAPPTDDGEQTVTGPDRDVRGARALTMCGTSLAFPNADHLDPEHQLGYAVASVEGYDGRTLQVYGSARKAAEQMDLLRSQVGGCTRDAGGDGLSDRVFTTFGSRPGDATTFGWTYEVEEGVGAPAGQLYTVVRVGTAVLAVEWSGEGGAEARAGWVPDQLALVDLIADEMCVFTADGCGTAREDASPAPDDAEGSDEPDVEAGVVTRIPDGIPLGQDLWDGSGDGGEYHPTPYHPAADEERWPIAPCGVEVWPRPDTVEELWAWATGPEYADRRAIVTLPSVDSAVAALADIRAALEACPEDGTLVWTPHAIDTGYDSVVFSLSYDSLGLHTYLVTRVANAILLTDRYGEGHISYAEEGARAQVGLTRTLASYLCVFSEAGC